MASGGACGAPRAGKPPSHMPLLERESSERHSPWMACLRRAGEGACGPFPIQAAADQPLRARAGAARPLLRVALARVAAGVAAPQATTLIGWFTDLPAA